MIGALIAAAVWLNNTSLWTTPNSKPLLLAHRGLAQTYDSAGLTNTTCTAARIHPPEHPYIENTISSMQAAFSAGADIVELDIHPTTDGQFAVFHDWTLDCRTDGRGVTREQSMADLKKLDVGYGYTSDGGETFPFRGKGVGLMPTLDEVLALFPDKRFLIHVKSSDPAEGELLEKRLTTLPPNQLEKLMVYGGDRPVAVVRARLPKIQTMSKATLKSCVIRYWLIGWAGFVPADCNHSLILMPMDYASWTWGWPNLFVKRMKRVGSDVFLIGPNEGEPFSRGIDSREDLRNVPKSFSGGIWTNRIDRIAPLLASEK
jgi:glycerophosphoryl diester phosphodiesterase